MPINSEIAEALGKASPVEPEWLRLPDAGKFCGCSARMIENLANAKLIKSRRLKGDPANERGIRIIYLPSLREYIENSPE